VALKRRKRSAPAETLGPADLAGEVRRTSRLLALLLVKGESQHEKIRVLCSVGFPNNEIADLLGIPANTVKVTLFRQRTKK
jgi:DNA-directed RNA polymerase specialized sigma24 family protein